MMLPIGLIAGTVLAATLALATETPLDPRDIVWLKMPSPEDVARRLPTDRRSGGRVAMDCEVTAVGLLADCRITSDDSDGQWLSALALKLSPKFRAARLTRSGVPSAGRRATVPFLFKSPEEPTEAPAEPEVK